MGSIIQDKDRRPIAERLETLARPVTLVNFTQELECEFCRETRQLIEELAGLSDKLTAEVYDFIADQPKAREDNINKIPATVVMGERDYGIRFYGIPSGYEFSILLEDIISVSKGDSGLTAENKKKLREMHEPLHLQVFVTPT
jgi:alkyl hydroperoxide reductase subunit AhpF